MRKLLKMSLKNGKAKKCLFSFYPLTVLFLMVYFGTRGHVAGKCFSHRKKRFSAFKHPTVFAVVSQQAIFGTVAYMVNVKGLQTRDVRKAG